MRIEASRTWAGAAAVLSIALAACVAEDAEPTPGPEPDAIVATTPIALDSTTLRYCLAPELGEATPMVATLIAALADAPGDGNVELVYVPEADAACRFDNPDIDLAIASWNDGGGCSSTTEDLACMVRTLLVDLDDLGGSTADLADAEVAADLRMQLDFMRDLGLGTASAPPIVGTPPPDPATTGCSNAMITSIVPAAPTSYQSATLAATYQVDPGCSQVAFSWSSDLDGWFGAGPSAVHQFSVGSHQVTFAVIATCVDPNDPTQTPVVYTCANTIKLDVTQGVLPQGDYCSHTADWWMAEEAAGNVHIQDESQTTVANLTGSNLQDLLIGNDRPNRINGKQHGDCLIGHGSFDSIEGHGGADTISGDDGDDRIVGHDDRDAIRAGRGNDKVRGGNGGDSLYGEDGDDKLDGNFDADTIFGGAGYDRLLGGWDDDYLAGGDGDDCIKGGDGADQMLGDRGADDLDGDFGMDSLAGGDGDDILHGGTNDDVIHGNAGNDSLYGAVGDDDLNGDDGDDVLCGGVGWNDYKNGGNHVNGDTCAFGGTNVACESTPLVCPLPLYISC